MATLKAEVGGSLEPMSLRLALNLQSKTYLNNNN
jgi:hypothetical protein